ncbi:MAG: DUF4402 domain-containing protein [Bacteroidales bacterium]
MHRITLISLLLLMFTIGNASAQSTITSEAFAEIVEVLTATETDQLNFGRFSTDVSGGDIIISPDGNRTIQGSIIGVAGAYGPGVFQVTGAPEASFTVQLPQGPAVLIHQQTSKTMLVEDWITDPPLENGPVTLSNGERVISLGATLNVGSYDDNPIGIYSGTFQLVFAYN